jgi:hypothetical protein
MTGGPPRQDDVTESQKKNRATHHTNSVSVGVFIVMLDVKVSDVAQKLQTAKKNYILATEI